MAGPLPRTPLPARGGADGPREFAPGEVLGGRYRVEEPIGGGAYGKVYRATLLFTGAPSSVPPMGREVAIKVLDSTHSDGAQRFTREAAIARRLEHPNTVRLFELGATDDGRPFLAMELLRGRALDDILAKDGPLPVESALTIAKQMLASLAEAHEQGIIHRDLKPANVFVTSHAGEPLFVKVLDFGLAKDLLGNVTGPRGTRYPALTRMGEVMGTPTYMAPEQATNQPLSPRTDLYAVGLVLAEMIAGKPLVVGANVADILLKQARGSSVPLPDVVARSIAAPIVARALAKRPEHRYASARAMLRDIQRALAPQPTTRVWSRSSVVVLAGVVGLLLCLSTVGIYLLATRGDTKTESRRRDDDREDEAPPKKKPKASSSVAPSLRALSAWPFSLAPGSSSSAARVVGAPLPPPRSFRPEVVEATLRRAGYHVDDKQSWSQDEASGVQLYVSKGRCKGLVQIDHRPKTATFVANGVNSNPGYRAFATEDDVVAIAMSNDKSGTSTFDCTDPLAKALAE